MLNIKTHSKFSIITICNWDEYQQDEQQVNNRRTTDEQQVNTDKNVKNDKNDKKIKYGEYVLLTEAEYGQLVERLGESTTNDYIERLNNYIGSRGKKYKSHYHTILNWVRRDADKVPPQPNRRRQLYMPEGDE